MKSGSPINSISLGDQSRPNSPESYDTATEGRDSPRSYYTATEGRDSPRSISSEPFFPPDPNVEQSPPNSPLGPYGGGRGRSRAG